MKLSRKNKKKKEPKPIGVEYRQFGKLRVLSIVLAFVFGAILLGSGFFLHKHIFQIIGQAQRINEIGEVAVVEAVDFKKLDSTLGAWDYKYSRDPYVLTRNPFEQVFLLEVD